MSKGKLAKFADMERFENVFQYPYSVVDDVPFDMKGKWREMYFHNDNPIVLELGCGKGEYTVELAEDEVQEIWLTFSDPQMKNPRKRLTSTYFMNRYRHFLMDGGIIHLKTDSNFLFTYTTYMVDGNHLPVLFRTEDLYHQEGIDEETRKILSIQTYYESMWIERGLNIKYQKFALPREGELVEPDIEIPLDDYRSYRRDKRSSKDTESVLRVCCRQSSYVHFLHTECHSSP